MLARPIQRGGVYLAFAFLLLCFSTVSEAITVFDTTPFWNGTSTSGPIAAGPGLSRAFGQTFVAPATDTVLDSFSFFLESSLPVEYSGVVMQWDADRVIGPVLYRQTLLASSSLSPISGVNFVTGGLPLAAGDEYVTFIETPSGDANLRFGLVFDDRFAEGVLLGAPWGATFEQLSTLPWIDRFPNPSDAAFTAVFSAPGPQAVTEPSSLIFVAAGITGLIMTRMVRTAPARSSDSSRQHQSG